MKTILTSISLLFLSILLVIGCEVLEDSIEKDDSANIEKSSEITDIPNTQFEPIKREESEKPLGKDQIEKNTKGDS